MDRIQTDEMYFWLSMYLVSGLGNIACRNLLRRFGEPAAIFEAGFSDLIGVDGVRERVARNITERVFAIDPDREWRKIEDCGARIIPFNDVSYPRLLREIHDPPVILYAKGRSIPQGQDFIAVVGSRNATDYGRRAAEQIAFGMAEAGMGVSSGLARGIDSHAHSGCLMGKGFTVAVFGTGVDVLYPSSNKRLLERILETGTAVSEFPMGTAPEPRNFPIRNRIISGMCKGVVVVEATKRSGSLITASLALEQGRDVFAVPGSIDSFKSTGTHFLIKQGAKLVENADDILSERGFGLSDEEPEPVENIEKRTLNLTLDEKRVFECLGPYPVHIDEIIRSLEEDAGAVLGILTRLELNGVVRQLPGMTFERAEKA
jgi:DNA processing protein